MSVFGNRNYAQQPVARTPGYGKAAQTSAYVQNMNNQNKRQNKQENLQGMSTLANSLREGACWVGQRMRSCPDMRAAQPRRPWPRQLEPPRVHWAGWELAAQQAQRSLVQRSGWGPMQQPVEQPLEQLVAESRLGLGQHWHQTL
jgi:hypothetical protein